MSAAGEFDTILAKAADPKSSYFLSGRFRRLRDSDHPSLAGATSLEEESLLRMLFSMDEYALFAANARVVAARSPFVLSLVLLIRDLLQEREVVSSRAQTLAGAGHFRIAMDLSHDIEGMHPFDRTAIVL